MEIIIPAPAIAIGKRIVPIPPKASLIAPPISLITDVTHRIIKLDL